jgi:hypothetical protein
MVGHEFVRRLRIRCGFAETLLPGRDEQQGHPCAGEGDGADHEAEDPQRDDHDLVIGGSADTD